MMKIAAILALIAPLALCEDVWVAYINNNTFGPATKYVLEANLTFTALPGAGVQYTFKGISGFLNELAPAFTYHIHQTPVKGESCGTASTGGHFDPFGVAVPTYNPVPGNLSSYEVGDLSGKWGAINATLSGQVAQFTIDDSTLSLNESDINYIGFKSIVIHAKNSTGTRLACANIVPVAEYLELVAPKTLPVDTATATQTETPSTTTTVDVTETIDNPNMGRNTGSIVPPTSVLTLALVAVLEIIFLI